ncbi:hypothetical protein Leryth_025021 [Lithospermum erythrorhizon]|nr:hypothetical protein Leryth_025021 [Lithospermum erythrorhizon]
MVCSWIVNSIVSHLREQFEEKCLSQGNLSVVTYFSKMKRLWDELNMLEPLPECKLDGVKDQIIVMDPWPTINKAYSIVLRGEEENGKQIGK